MVTFSIFLAQVVSNPFTMNTSAPIPPPTDRAQKATPFSGFNRVSELGTTTTNTAIANFFQGPALKHREIARSTYTTYCEFHKNDRRQTDNNSAVLFVKSMLVMLRSEDPMAAILYYDEAARANLLCHPSHVPHAPEELNTYFPRIFINRGRIKVKYRLITSIPVADIKHRIMHKLMESEFFIYPSRLSAIRTSQVGWMYLAYPDLTNREEFTTILRLLLQ